MSKICDRNYQENSMYSAKMINGIACCPSCEKPTICHGKSVERRSLFWALSGDTGISSEALAGHMTGYPGNTRFGMQPPSDADDRGRCIRLLELIPEWLPRLPEMVKYDAKAEKKTEGFVINSSGITADHNTWAKQIPLIMQEGKFA